MNMIEVESMTDEADEVVFIETEKDVPLKGLPKIQAFGAIRHNGFYAYKEKSTGNKILLVADF